MAESTDFYSILGVSRNASDTEIKAAYRKQALKWHPDKHTGEEKKIAEQRFKEVNQAYEVLRDSHKRGLYDQMGHTAFTQGGSGGPAGFGAGGPFSGGFGAGGPFRYTYSTTGNVNIEDLFGTSDPFDIFEQFFGGSYARSRAQKPVYHATIDFMEAVKGIEKSFVIQGSQKKVKIPAGVSSNTRIRFNEFDLIIEVRPHKVFKRQGQDIVVDQPITFPQAAMGATIEVPTIDGTFKLKVRPGTQPGTLVRLREKGVVYPRTNRRGDQYVRFIVEVPRNLTGKQRELLKEFEQNL